MEVSQVMGMLAVQVRTSPAGVFFFANRNIVPLLLYQSLHDANTRLGKKGSCPRNRLLNMSALSLTYETSSAFVEMRFSRVLMASQQIRGMRVRKPIEKLV